MQMHRFPSDRKAARDAARITAFWMSPPENFSNSEAKDLSLAPKSPNWKNSFSWFPNVSHLFMQHFHRMVAKLLALCHIMSAGQALEINIITAWSKFWQACFLAMGREWTLEFSTITIPGLLRYMPAWKHEILMNLKYIYTVTLHSIRYTVYPPSYGNPNQCNIRLPGRGNNSEATRTAHIALCVASLPQFCSCGTVRWQKPHCS